MNARVLSCCAAACLAAVMISGCGRADAPRPEQAPAAATPPAAAAKAPSADLSGVATAMVQAAMVKTGEHVYITRSSRDEELLENLAIETMKAGAQPLVSLASERLERRSYTEVPASYDNQPPTLFLALVNTLDAMLTVETGETEDNMAGVPPERMAARAKAGLPANEACLKKPVRAVNLGNGLYPTPALAQRLGKPLQELADVFWKAARVPVDVVRAKGAAVREALGAGQRLALSSPDGTNITFAVEPAKGFVSDGAISPEKVQQGRAAVQTWLPAGELLVPVVLGSAEGKVVVGKLVVQGTLVEGLTLSFTKGKLTSMTARSGLDRLKALYDAAGAGKNFLSYLDIGLNPEARLPTDTGRIVWMAPGGVTVGMGDNTGWGGTNTSTFGLPCAVSGATLSVDGKAVIENGVLK
jgi:leucyl aminopeptidase (aminopeptidase T)